MSEGEDRDESSGKEETEELVTEGDQDSPAFNKESGIIMLIVWTIFIVLVFIFLAICLYYRKRNNANGHLNVAPTSTRLEYKTRDDNQKAGPAENSLESCL